jgi:hypothetical protein
MRKYFARTAVGRNEQRRFTGDILKVSAVGFIGGPILDALRTSSDGGAFGPLGAAASILLGLVMALLGVYLIGSREPES